MVNKAIENAKYHGINLYHGVPNMADGNCAFESIIDNISTRSCFEERFEGTPDHWRFVWMGIIQKIAYSKWHGNLSLERWNAEFEILKQSRTYEVQLGDLVVPGIAHCTQKNILIFNTSEHAHSPVYVIPATTFGGTANTDIPVCLAYNQIHYEGLVPCSDEDIAKTKDLTKQFITGEYNISKNEIPIFQRKAKEIYDKEFPLLESQIDKISKKKTSKLSEDNAEFPLSLDDLKKIPVKVRTPEQTKVYNRLMANKRKQSLTKEQLDEIRIKNTEKKRIYRKNQSEEDKKRNNLQQKEASDKSRKTRTPEERKRVNLQQREAMDKLRKTRTPEERKRAKLQQREAMDKLRKTRTPEERKRDNLQQKEATEKLRKTQNKNKTDLERLLCFQNATR